FALRRAAAIGRVLGVRIARCGGRAGRCLDLIRRTIASRLGALTSLAAWGARITSALGVSGSDRGRCRSSLRRLLLVDALFVDEIVVCAVVERGRPKPNRRIASRPDKHIGAGEYFVALTRLHSVRARAKLEEERLTGLKVANLRPIDIKLTRRKLACDGDLDGRSDRIRGGMLLRAVRALIVARKDARDGGEKKNHAKRQEKDDEGMLPKRGARGNVLALRRASAFDVGAGFLCDRLNRRLTRRRDDGALGVLAGERVLLIARERIVARRLKTRAVEVNDEAGDVVVPPTFVRLSDERARCLFGISNCPEGFGDRA